MSKLYSILIEEQKNKQQAVEKRMQDRVPKVAIEQLRSKRRKIAMTKL